MMSAVVPPQEELRELYRELILDHARKPRHFGKLASASHAAEGINPLCGDKLKLYLDIDADANIRDAAFEGSGCAIYVASASLLTDTVIGMPAADALAFFETIVAALAGKGEQRGLELGKLSALMGVRDYPSRVKCATLAWHALHSAIKDDSKPATTE
jgi:nitrogen fixation NifU-like protein